MLDEMHVPVNKPIRVHLKSQDVIHSFFVPSFRIKQDAVPGREIVAWFDATKPGKYEWPCAELCGFGHSGMRGWIYVHTPEEYEKWAAETLRADAAPPAADRKADAATGDDRTETMSTAAARPDDAAKGKAKR
jgi:cytochrome c oxidase subunit 2